MDKVIFISKDFHGCYSIKWNKFYSSWEFKVFVAFSHCLEILIKMPEYTDTGMNSCFKKQKVHACKTRSIETITETRDRNGAQYQDHCISHVRLCCCDTEFRNYWLIPTATSFSTFSHVALLPNKIISWLSDHVELIPYIQYHTNQKKTINVTLFRAVFIMFNGYSTNCDHSAFVSISQSYTHISLPLNDIFYETFINVSQIWKNFQLRTT